MTTVDSLLKLYKKLCGKDYAYEVDPTDAEVIDKIAEDAETGEGSGVEAKIGDLDDLDTTDKTNLVAAINEVAESGGSGSSKTYVTATLGTNKIAEDLTEDDLLNMVINLPDGVYPVCAILYDYADSVRIPDLFGVVVAGPWQGITYKPSTGDLIVPGD